MALKASLSFLLAVTLIAMASSQEKDEFENDSPAGGEKTDCSPFFMGNKELSFQVFGI